MTDTGLYHETDYPVAARLVQLFFALISGMVIAQFGLDLLITQLGGTELSAQLSALKSGEDVSPYPALVLQALNQLSGFGLAALVLNFSTGESLLAWRKVPVPGFIWFYIPLLIALALPGSAAISFNAQSFALPGALHELEILLEETENESAQMIAGLLQTQSLPDRLLRLCIFALIPALCEEFFFRGALLSLISRKLPLHLAVWITAFIFSLVHFQVFGFFARAALGALFAYLRAYTGSIWPAVWGHFLFNAGSLLLFYQLFPGLDFNEDPASISPLLQWLCLFLCLLLSFSGLLYLHKRPDTNGSESPA